MKRILALQDRVTPTAKWRWAYSAFTWALTGLILTFCAWLIDGQKLSFVFAGLLSGGFWYTVLLLGFFAALLSLLCRSLFAGGSITALAAIILSLINHYKLKITSTPLQLSEFALADKLGDITALNAKVLTPTASTVAAVVITLLWLAALAFFSRPLRLEWKKSAAAAALPAFLLIFCFWFSSDGVVFTPLQLPLEQSVSQSVANNECGVLLGLWRSFAQSQLVNQGENVTQEDIDAIIEEDTGTEEQPPAVVEPPVELDPPNVLLILSESFFDVTRLPEVYFTEDPLADFHALQKEGVSGSFYTRTLGYGTCNIELEVLTGINTTLMNNEELYAQKPEFFTKLPTVPALLQQNGYRTVMFHLFNDSIYNRRPIFESLGFDEIYFSDDFQKIDEEAAAAETYWSYMKDKISGEFYSDDYMSDLFIKLLEQEGEEPLFAYGISMENHSPHNGSKYAYNGGYDVEFTTTLQGEARGVLADAIEGSSNASEALGKLTDYLKEQEEPTVVIFFGDHLPGLGLSDGSSTVYSELDMSEGYDQGKWTLEQILELHSADYLIWSNDPAYLPAQPGSTLDSSCNYFGLNILDAAQAELPLYWELIEDAGKVRVIDTLEYHLGRDGEGGRMASSDEEDKRRLDLLATCLYDTFSGEGQLTEQLWK